MRAHTGGGLLASLGVGLLPYDARAGSVSLRWQPLTRSEVPPVKSIAFFNNKGGVGKTTLACNFAAYLAKRRHNP